MTNALQSLVQHARNVQMTVGQQEEQRRSFAYGNTAFENENITREMVDQEAANLLREADHVASR
jgi:hypothetical protein